MPFDHPLTGEENADFLVRGEKAWQEYLRTGQSRSASEVFRAVQVRIEARRSELLNTA
jgi:hypothetical protein